MKIPAGDYILAIFKRRRRLVVRFVFSALVRAALIMATILLIREFLSGVLGEGRGFAAAVRDTFGTNAALWTVALLLVATYIGSSLANYDNRVTQQRIVKFLELGMMEGLIRHLLTLSVPFFDRQSHGDVIEAVRQDVTNLRVIVLALGRFLLELLTALGLAAAAVWLSPSLTFWTLIVLPVASLPIYFIARRTLARSRTVRQTGYVLFDVILQLLRGIRVIKVFRGEEGEAQIAVEKGTRYFDELIEMVRVRQLSEVVLQSLAGFGIVLVVVIGGFQVLGNTLTWPELLAFLMAARALHGPLNNLTTSYMDIQQHGASAERINELFSLSPEVVDRPDAAPLESGPAVIQFDRVGFRYDEDPVLRDITLELRAGETLGIAGPSGAGKTSFLNLVARFYDPTEGAVRFDGRDVREYRLADLYDKIAIVTQEPFLFATTVRNNIQCGRLGASEDEIVAAAEAAEIHTDILDLPDGYDTVIGIGGRNLSLGQAQRINIARAVLKNAPILLLDEATSSLDSLAEEKVQKAVDRLVEGRTTFVVAHRLSTLRNADRIMVIDQTRCVGLGPHDELLETCELYAQLWATQLLGNDQPVDGSARTEPVHQLDLVNPPEPESVTEV